MATLQILKLVTEDTLLQDSLQGTLNSKQFNNQHVIDKRNRIDVDGEKSAGKFNQSNLWACIIEQGLVPHLEMIATGIPIVCYKSNYSDKKGKEYKETSDHNSSLQKMTDVFPEKNIRNIAKYLLDELASNLKKHSIICIRVVNAMMHTGNLKLRLNILSGLVLLVGRRSDLGRYCRTYCCGTLLYYYYLLICLN